MHFLVLKSKIQTKKENANGSDLIKKYESASKKNDGSGSVSPRKKLNRKLSNTQQNDITKFLSHDSNAYDLITEANNGPSQNDNNKVESSLYNLIKVFIIERPIKSKKNYFLGYCN